LDANDKRDVINLLSPKDFDLNAKRRLNNRLGNVLNTIEVVFEWTDLSQNSYIKFGPIYLGDNTLCLKEKASGSTLNLDNLIRSLASPDKFKSFEVSFGEAEVWQSNRLKTNIFAILRPKFSFFAEYRGRPTKINRTAVLNSFEGNQTANVLLNLKNHREKRYRDRYIGVKYAFSSFFPQLKFEAVETEPGSVIADIQFIKIGENYPVPIENVGAGISELLTLLTNLVTLRGHIFVIEEPELHLHPHAKRKLAKLIKNSSTHSQVFIITHDPVFIDPDHIENLNRVYFKSKRFGTSLASLSNNLSPREIGQIKTASRDIAKRELFFARAILFVEDESQQRFIEGCAKKLDCDLDSSGISIIEVGGQDAFLPYIKLAEQLEIPFICLADLPWGSKTDWPTKVYYTLGCELEQYLEQGDCGSLMEDAKKEVGRSKQRVAKYCGEHIEKDKIPTFFSNLLGEIIRLSTKTK